MGFIEAFLHFFLGLFVGVVIGFALTSIYVIWVVIMEDWKMEKTEGKRWN